MFQYTCTSFSATIKKKKKFAAFYFISQFQLPHGGVDMTFGELQEISVRQQRELETQQKILLTKEQRLKFLRNRDAQHLQIAEENERLRKLRERVESQELKLKKLRALRGQAEQQKLNNGNLSK